MLFRKYEKVEKADGTLIEIPELLDLERKAARDAIAAEPILKSSKRRILSLR
jgi:hypothetical protein